MTTVVFVRRRHLPTRNYEIIFLFPMVVLVETCWSRGLFARRVTTETRSTVSAINEWVHGARSIWPIRNRVEWSKNRRSDSNDVSVPHRSAPWDRNLCSPWFHYPCVGHWLVRRSVARAVDSIWPWASEEENKVTWCEKTVLAFYFEEEADHC